MAEKKAIAVFASVAAALLAAQHHAFNPDTTQSQDGCGQYGDDQFSGRDEDEIDDHSNSWYEDYDMYCEDEEEEVDIAEEPFFYR